MANNTTLTKLQGSPKVGYEWWQSFLGDGSTKVKATVTGDAICIDGAVSVAVHIRLGTYTDGTFTTTIQGSNDLANWANIGAATSGMVAAGEESTGIVEASSNTTGKVGYGVNLPRWVRAVVTVTGGPATGALITFVYVKVLHSGVTGGA